MWRVNIHCDGDAWKRSGAEFKAMTQNYQAELIVSQKRPDETRLMAYKIEDISEVENFQEDCTKFPGFTSDFESF
ncbi:hypothetical protein VB715_15950 [Crocosphaera sp. UHCC 0190]|uniref:hypothetical protein n=1 Tax=Crocosphaera sp. UHCC 0190 TaxID=3110246 RepID=UPI002B206C92|nr:hypothetical protein [Crocosphaera sp. UHCC 0190]MEA5511266.1 hypothetical protein [Crocosphaera sp. UHCC 0190]